MDDHLISRRAVIVGGGLAGLFAARELRHRSFEVTVVDRAAHHLFQPRLYQCATGVQSEGLIAGSSTLVDPVDPTMVPAVRASTQRPDRFGLG
jgi:2-polyprenyl-6-methoxyphenol hydroxylase-like FAD-dependent oxidoreductase